MKKLFASILISLICALSSIILAIESNIEIQTSSLNSLEVHQKKVEFVPLINAPLISIQKDEDVEIDLNPNVLGSWPTLGEEASTTNYYLVSPPINNKNNIYYKGSYTLTINDKLVHVLDSLVSLDTIYTLLEEHLSVYSEYTNMIVHTVKYELIKFKREKQLDATVNLVTWLPLLILSLLFAFIYQDEDYIRNPLIIIAIASLIFIILNIPDIIILFTGADYSVLNGLGV